jgi:hypothetical protein
VLDLRIQLRADEDRQGGHVKPQHQDDRATDDAVGCGVRREVGDVVLEGEGNQQPQRGRE